MSISLVSQRVFHESADISLAVSDYKSANYPITYTAGDYIYIGTTSPMTNVWVEMSTVSGVDAGKAIVELWFNRAWAPAVDILDQTNGMMSKGRISWTVEKYNGGWNCEPKSEDIGLSGTNIYDRYWLRISWPGSFNAVLEILGQKFSDDTSLATYYPDLVLNTQLLTGFKPGKTNWDEQHFAASDLILKDLRKRKVIKEANQVYDWQVMEEASCHRVAEIIYSAFGAPYREHMLLAHKKYEEEIAGVFNFDLDMSGSLDEFERNDSIGWMKR